MKNIKLGFIVMAAIISFTPLAETKAQQVSISFSTFQQELSPYGRWMNNPRFGQVWINYDANFRPYYTDGHWEYTNYGWSWISDYDWGWAPFHYGRWEYDPFYGWMWIPGYEWGAAWVSWSSYDDYYGWAPLGYGNNINISFGSIPYNNWTFIPRRNICDRDLNRYYVSHRQDNRFRNAVVINNYYNGRGNIGRFVRGPERREVERYTGNNIQERRIDYTDRRLNRSNATLNNSNNTGIRNADGTVPGNNGNPGIRNNPAQNDANTGNNRFETTKPVKENRVKRNDDQQNNVPQQNNNRGNRDIKPNPNTTTTPPVYENNKPNREVKRMPPVKEDTDAGTPQNENRMKRYDNQQNNVPQRQQNTRPVPQQQREPVMQPQQQRQPAMQPQQQNNRPAPQQQRQPVMQPQQQRQPAVQPQQQRSSDNRVDGNAAGKNMQQSNGNSQRQNTKNGKSNIQQ